MTMPERIWAAEPDNDGRGYGLFSADPNFSARRTEYLRADLAAAQDARIAELEAALRPFARFHDALAKMGGNMPKRGPFYTIEVGSPNERELSIEDFARASAALGDAP